MIFNVDLDMTVRHYERLEKECYYYDYITALRLEYDVSGYDGMDEYKLMSVKAILADSFPSFELFGSRIDAIEHDIQKNGDFIIIEKAAMDQFNSNLKGD